MPAPDSQLGVSDQAAAASRDTLREGFNIAWWVGLMMSFRGWTNFWRTVLPAWLGAEVPGWMQTSLRLGALLLVLFAVFRSIRHLQSDRPATSGVTAADLAWMAYLAVFAIPTLAVVGHRISTGGTFEMFRNAEELLALGASAGAALLLAAISVRARREMLLPADPQESATE